MGSGNIHSVRALPRAFLDEIPEELPELIELPSSESDKFRKVLRLGTGDEVAILAGDGRLIRCTIEGKSVRPTSVEYPQTESAIHLTLCLALPKPDACENAIRMGTEMGVSKFVLFPAERTVVRWDEKKKESRLHRLAIIARESAEVAFRTRLPEVEYEPNLGAVLTRFPEAVVLSEVEGVPKPYPPETNDIVAIIGPEGGWAKRELELIGDRAATLGPRVLRVDTAVAAACALTLLAPGR